MKQKILNAIAFFIIGACVGGITVSAIDANKVKHNEQAIIDSSRGSIIELNKFVNGLGQKLFVSSFVDNNVSTTAALKVLEALTPELIKLNKSLKLDCTEYKNGAPVSIEDENGSRKPVEVLPEEIRISK